MQKQAKVKGGQQFILCFTRMNAWDLKSLDRDIIRTVASRKTEFFGILSLTMTVNRSFCVFVLKIKLILVYFTN
jgi:hypothetical protein